MKRAILSILLFAVWGISQAGTLEIINASPISFSGYNGQPLSITGAERHGFLGALYATSAGTFFATYLGNESGYADSFYFGAGKGELIESNPFGATISQVVGIGTVNFGFSDDAGQGHVFKNGERQQNQNTYSFAIMDGQTNAYGNFDYILGFNDSYAGDADYDDFVVGVSFIAAPVPEPETYAMILAGLGLLGLSVRRRNNNPFD